MQTSSYINFQKSTFVCRGSQSLLRLSLPTVFFVWFIGVRAIESCASILVCAISLLFGWVSVLLFCTRSPYSFTGRLTLVRRVLLMRARVLLQCPCEG